MELCGQNIPDACFQGCPSIDFPAIAETIAAHEGDVEKVRASGASEAAVAAVAALDGEFEQQVALAVRDIPAKKTGPWRPETSGMEPSEQDAVGKTVCCQLAGVILLDLSSGEDVHLRRTDK